MLLVIGSHALVEHLPHSPPRDLDIIGDFDSIQQFVNQIVASGLKLKSAYPISGGTKYLYFFDQLIIEAEIAWPDSTATQLLSVVQPCKQITLYNTQLEIPDLNTLYTLKLSHRFLKNSPHFLKTMQDIHQLRAAGAFIPEYLKPFFKNRCKETYSYKHPKLNQNKAEFFGPEDFYVYDHDTIHLSVARGDVPAYTLFKSDQAEVWCDSTLFAALPKETQLNAVLEEALVLALERSQIPFVGKVSPRASFLMALEKVCTSITSGWFRTFAWEHYNEVIALYDDNYVNKFWSDVESGLVVKCA